MRERLVLSNYICTNRRRYQYTLNLEIEIMGRLSNQKRNYNHRSLGLVKPSELGASLYMISKMKLKVQNSKRNLFQYVLIVHVAGKNILCTGYIVADAKE